MAKITVVVPVYNAAPYLEVCTSSILAQTYADLCLLLINDGSTDASGALCDAIAANDPRVQVMHQENCGVAQTILRGIAAVDTPYTAFVDSDDWVLPEMLQQMLTAIETHAADLVQCGAFLDGDSSQPAFDSETLIVVEDINERLYRPFFETKADLAPFTNARWGKLYRTDLLQQASSMAQTELSIGEDLLLNLAYLPLCHKVVLLAKSNYYCYRSNAASLTAKYSDKKQNSILQLYPILSQRAKDANFRDDAVVSQGKNETCALMLEVLLSSLRVSEKAARLQLLFTHLSDRPHLLHYAKDRPLIGKVALYFVSLRLYWLIAALVSAVMLITSQKK